MISTIRNVLTKTLFSFTRIIKEQKQKSKIELKVSVHLHICECHETIVFHSISNILCISCSNSIQNQYFHTFEIEQSSSVSIINDKIKKAEKKNIANSNETK